MLSTTKLREYLKIDGTGKDTFLKACIDQAVSSIETYCNRKFVYGSYTDYLDGDCAENCFLKNYPVITVNKIEIRLDFEWEPLQDGTNYFIVSAKNQIELNTELPKGKNNVKITYTAGWNEDECNKDIENIIIEMASIIYFNSPISGDSRLGKASKSLNANTSEWMQYKDLTPNWKRRLDKYRIRQIA